MPNRRRSYNKMTTRQREAMPTDRLPTGAFPCGRWALVQLRAATLRYGTAWLVTYRGDVPIIAATDHPDSPSVPLPPEAGEILSTHAYREAPAGRAELLNRTVARLLADRPARVA